MRIKLPFVGFVFILITSCKSSNQIQDSQLLDSAIVEKIDANSICIKLKHGWDHRLVFLSIKDEKLLITSLDKNKIMQYPNHGVYYYGELNNKGLSYAVTHHLSQDPSNDELYGGIEASYFDVTGNGIPEYKMEKGKYYKMSNVEWAETPAIKVQEAMKTRGSEK